MRTKVSSFDFGTPYTGGDNKFEKKKQCAPRYAVYDNRRLII